MTNKQPEILRFPDPEILHGWLFCIPLTLSRSRVIVISQVFHVSHQLSCKTQKTHQKFKSLKGEKPKILGFRRNSVQIPDPKMYQGKKLPVEVGEVCCQTTILKIAELHFTSLPFG